MAKCPVFLSIGVLISLSGCQPADDGVTFRGKVTFDKPYKSASILLLPLGDGPSLAGPINAEDGTFELAGLKMGEYKARIRFVLTTNQVDEIGRNTPDTETFHQGVALDAETEPFTLSFSSGGQRRT